MTPIRDELIQVFDTLHSLSVDLLFEDLPREQYEDLQRSISAARHEIHQVLARYQVYVERLFDEPGTTHSDS